MSFRGSNDQSKLKKAVIFSIMMMAFFYCLLAVFEQINAQTNTSTIVEGVNVIEQPLGLPKTDIRVIAARIIQIALSLLGIITVVLIMYGGFIWMTAGGNDEQIGRAKKILVNATIGLAIILSAYAITLFIFRMLGVGDGQGGPTYPAPGSQHFAGSGALGQIIKDHYPERDQVDVPRNTKIVVSFRRPILASSTIMDTNGNGIFGDCLTSAVNFSWSDETICDRIRTNDGKIAKSGSEQGMLNDKYINIKQTDTGTSIDGGAVLAPVTKENNVEGVYTLIIVPLTDLSKTSGGYLGNSVSKLGYTVHLGSEIRLDDALNSHPRAFDSSNLGNNYYEWNFKTDTSLDINPPTVKSVYPLANSVAPKNSIIQINFSEPMDPTGIQGGFASGTQEYYLQNGFIYLKTTNTSAPLGSFKLTNGYRTLEFASSVECSEKNACGNPMYCLPVCDLSGTCPKVLVSTGKANKYESVEADSYSLMLKTAQTFGLASFESKPFTGIADLAGNALDGDADDAVDIATSTTPVFDNQLAPDNYFWKFMIKDKMDLASPYMTKLTPGPDAGNVVPNQELSMNFTKPMRTDSMYNIKLEEYAHSGPQSAIPVCYVPRVYVYTDWTYTKIQHCDFLFASRYDYLPIVPSEVEDVNFNCYYPGLGPDKLDLKSATKDSTVCNGSSNCCDVSTTTPGKGDLCCNGSSKNDAGQTFNSSTCRSYINSY